MLDIAIVDDELAERERLKACLAYVEEQQGVSFSVQEYESADQFLMMFEQQYDIVFMDIQFAGGMDGMSAARQMRKADPSVLLIFVTNLAQMALHGYEVDALDFVVKPLDPYAFHLKMQRALGRVSSRKKSTIEVRDKGSTVYLDTQDPIPGSQRALCHLPHTWRQLHRVHIHGGSGKEAERSRLLPMRQGPDHQHADADKDRG